MTTEFVAVILIGFFAQMIDGALGMGFGVLCSSFLLMIGVPPTLASSSVHMAKLLTNGASGLSHWRLGNVDKHLLIPLLVAGMVGGVVGALLLTVLPHGVAKPFIAVYLFVTGMMILWRALHHDVKATPTKSNRVGLAGLGGIGGFMDAIGGGGWGPVVTSSLVMQGNQPRTAIGSSNLAEFFVSIAIFTVLAGHAPILEQGQIILGLIIGGVLAAPLAAYVCGRMAPRQMMFALGSLIILLSLGVF